VTLIDRILHWIMPNSVSPTTPNWLPLLMPHIRKIAMRHGCRYEVVGDTLYLFRGQWNDGHGRGIRCEALIDMAKADEWEKLEGALETACATRAPTTR